MNPRLQSGNPWRFGEQTADSCAENVNPTKCPTAQSNDNYYAVLPKIFVKVLTKKTSCVIIIIVVLNKK